MRVLPLGVIALPGLYLHHVKTLLDRQAAYRRLVGLRHRSGLRLLPQQDVPDAVGGAGPVLDEPDQREDASSAGCMNKQDSLDFLWVFAKMRFLNDLCLLH